MWKKLNFGLPARIMRELFRLKGALKMTFKISIHEENRITYMMVAEDELDAIVDRYPDAEIFILNILG